MRSNERPSSLRLRMTRQRRVILEELRRAEDHPTADALYQRVRRRLPRISLGTVYRNLEVLVRQREVRRLRVGGEAGRFDGRAEAHHHVRCVRCGCLADVPAGTCTISVEDVRRATGFRLLEARLELTGTCRDCQAAEAGGAGNRTKRAAAVGPRSSKGKPGAGSVPRKRRQT
ncbi:MAG TPA: transcriptional repressor [Phycisphaerae bacterium]|nr:transcriptional repressor [Phycisphaerae bacterium]